MFVENTEYEIMTPDGWRDFKGIMLNGKQVTYRITLSNGRFVDATAEHCFFIDNKKVKTSTLNVGDFIDTCDGKSSIVNIKENIESTVYDIVEVDQENHQFIVNNCFITKNCDEFSFIKPRIADEFWTAMAPTLSTGGKCIITSTPNSDEDKFAEIWVGANKTIDEWGNEIPGGLGVNGFRAFTAHYSEVPGRDEAWAQLERAKIGADKFDREYDCKFLTADETLVNAVTLLKLQGIDPKFKTHNEVRWYKTPEPNQIYLVALDPSAGVGKDFSAIEVFSLPNMQQVAEWSHNRTSIPNQVKTLQNIIKHIYNELKKHPDQRGEPEIYFTVENNSWGEAALVSINEIGEERFQATMLHEPRVRGVARPRKGLNTNGRTKALACSKFKSLVESEKLKLYSRMLVRQIKFFVSKGDGFAAKQGEHDDCVMATLMCVRMMQMVQNWDDRLTDILKDDFGDDGEYVEPLPFSVIIN